MPRRAWINRVLRTLFELIWRELDAAYTASLWVDVPRGGWPGRLSCYNRAEDPPPKTPRE